MKVIIAGTRHFNDYPLLKEKCDYYLQNYQDIEIVSGCAEGADKLGEIYGIENGYPVKKFPADWSLGKIAGPKRNAEMAFYADALICFWDGASRGAKNMIELATEKGMKVKVVKYQVGRVDL